MSRIGRLPVQVPSGVKVEVRGSRVTVTGPKGVLEADMPREITVTLNDGQVLVARQSDEPAHRAKHGLVRALINNMVTGVTKGYEKVLELQGVGYRASLQGKAITLTLGYSHPITVEPPAGIEFAVEGANIIRVRGIDKQRVGQVAANIRALRKPEPYKGKGVRYQGEYVRRKVGKSGAK